MNQLIIAPLILAFLSGIILIVLSYPLSRIPKKAWIFSSLSFVLQLICGILIVKTTLNSGPIQIQVGSWDSPYGISLYADAFSGLMISVCSLVGLAGALYLPVFKDEALKIKQRFIQPLIQFLFIGVHGAFIAGDLFNLYVWFEVLLISSFILLVLAGNMKKRATRGALKYVVINLLASLLFLIGVSLVYQKVGTLNLQDLAHKIPLTLNKSELFLLSPFFIIAFGIKSAIFPLFFWLPDSYPTAIPSISGIFAGILTKVGIYAFVRVFPLLFGSIFYEYSPFFITLATLTMIIGVMAAATRKSIKEILSFHIISQIGYMFFAFALGTDLGLAACVFYLLHHIIAKANLFFIGGIVETYFGSDRLALHGGLLKTKPWLALIFIPPAMALAGLPPFSGFFAKLLVLDSGLQAGQFLSITIALIVGFFTLYSMAKIWNASFWGSAKAIKAEIPARQVIVVSILSLCSLSLGLSFIFFEPIGLKIGRELASPLILKGGS